MNRDPWTRTRSSTLLFIAYARAVRRERERMVTVSSGVYDRGPCLDHDHGIIYRSLTAPWQMIRIEKVGSWRPQVRRIYISNDLGKISATFFFFFSFFFTDYHTYLRDTRYQSSIHIYIYLKYIVSHFSLPLLLFVYITREVCTRYDPETECQFRIIPCSSPFKGVKTGKRGEGGGGGGGGNVSRLSFRWGHLVGRVACEPVRDRTSLRETPEG